MLTKGYKDLSDTDLIDLLTKSNHAAYTEIYKRYFHMLYIHAYKKLRDEDEAEDIIHELFALLWCKREFLSNINNLQAYLFTCLRNKIFDLFSHQKVEQRYLDSFNNYLENAKNVPTDYRLRENELKAYIENVIQNLPPKMREIFELSRKEHLSHREIAMKLGTTENNVSKQVTDALGRLRTKLV